MKDSNRNKITTSYYVTTSIMTAIIIVISNYFQLMMLGIICAPIIWGVIFKVIIRSNYRR